MPLIEAIAVDRPQVLIGNVLNTAITCRAFPRDFAVEIPLHASKQGCAGDPDRSAAAIR